jgi:hypothetical protein
MTGTTTQMSTPASVAPESPWTPWVFSVWDSHGALASGAHYPSASLRDLRQVSTHQIAPFVQAECIAPRAVPVKLFLPFHQVRFAAVFLDEFADAVTNLTGRAFFLRLTTLDLSLHQTHSAPQVFGV